VLLANLAPPQLEAYLTRVKLVPLTPKTVTSAPELRRILNTVRAQDFSLLDQEFEMGLRSIAVPVRDTTGNVVASMNVGAQAALLSAQQMKETVLPHLFAAAQDLGGLLRP
jgi:IclR family pca regulon transcriptional regulator